MLSVASCSTSKPLRKRGNDSDHESPDIKVRREDLYFVLESESDTTCSEEDTESCFSLQNKSTDLAKDTSDTSSKTSRRISESQSGIEYEVVSLSEKEAPFSDCSSGTDLDQNQCRWIRGIESGDEAEGGSVWADGSSAATEPDLRESSGMPLRQRHCLKCKAATNLLQFCDRCYKVRKDFFPARPRHFKKKPGKRTQKKKPNPMEVDNAQAISSWVESSSSQELLLTSGCTEAQGLCNVCFKNPKNAAFIHSQWAHIYSCYHCSLKIWCSTKCCPLCNGKVRRVLKVAIG